MNQKDSSHEPDIHDAGLMQSVQESSKFQLNQMDQLISKYAETIASHQETINNLLDQITNNKKLDADE